MKIYFCEKCGISIPLQEVVGGRATARDGKTYCQSCLPGDAPGGDDLKLYFCDNCKVSIPLQDVITNRAKAVGEEMLCADCAPLSESQRVVRRARIEKEVQEKEERRYRLHFCDSCNTSIPQSHLVTGRAVIRGGRTFCERCRDRAERRKVSASSAVVGALVLAVAFVGGYLALGAGQGLFARAPEKDADEAAKLREEVLVDVDQKLEPYEARFAELRGRIEQAMKDVQNRSQDQKLLTDSFEDLAELADDMQKSLASLKSDMEQRLSSQELSTRDLREKIAALSAKLQEQRATLPETGPAPRDVPPDAKPDAPLVPGPEAAPDPAPERPEASPEVRQWIAELEDEDAGVRFNAAVKLGDSGYKPAWEPLARVVEKDGDTFVRRVAARSIGKLNAWKAVPILIETLGDNEYFVAVMAHKALEAITGRDFGYRENLSKTERKRVVAKARDWWEKHAGDRAD